MPQRPIPKIGEDVSHLMGGGGDVPGIGEDVTHLFTGSASLPTRPVSPEDFIPSQPSKGWPAKLGDVVGGLAHILNPMPTIEALSDLQRAGMMGDMEASARTLARVKGMAGAQAGEFSKAAEQFGQGRYSEAAGHTIAGVLPAIGPVAANVAEEFPTDPYRAAGETAGLLAPFGAAEAMRAGAVPAARSASEAAARAMMTGAKGAAAKAGPTLAEAAKIAALEYAAHQLGIPPGVVTGGKIALKALEKVRKAEPATEASANAGGRLVTAQEPSLTQALADTLTEVNKATPPVRMTTPPQPELPAGYTPRTTVPKPKPVKMAAPTAEPTSAPEPTPPARAYFLKSPEQMAIEKAAAAEMPQTGKRLYFQKPLTEAAAADLLPAPTGSVGVEDLPEAWRSRITADFASKMKAVPADDVAAVRQQLQDSGLSLSDAMTAVAKNASLSAPVRAQLMKALMRAGGR